MKPIELDGFKRFKFISRLAFSPNGKNLAFVVSECDDKTNSYRSCIYVQKGSRTVRLTNGGSERDFRFIDDSTILFPASREGDGKDFFGSRYYKISLSGGEAELALELPMPVTSLTPLDKGRYLVTAKTVPGFEELYKCDKKYIAAYKKHLKDNEDYEEIAQNPWWWNGSTFTKGAYESLFVYDSRKKTFTRLTELNESVYSVKLGKDGQTVYFMRSDVKPIMNDRGEGTLCSVKTDGSERRTLCTCGENFELEGFELCDSFILLMANDCKYGRNTDNDFYTLPYEGGEPKLYAVYGRAVGSSVGSDIRYGGGKTLKAEGDKVYFISTVDDYAELYCLENGEVTRLTNKEGSVDSFDVCGGKLVMCALWDMLGQELYDGEGRRLTKLNAKPAKDYYTAVPEKLNIIVGDHELHGFVLKPIDAQPGKKSPVILDIHGGPKTVYGAVYYHEMQYWAGLGYYVIYCNPTGSDGRGGFMDILGKYGTVDYEDIMAFCDAALQNYPDMDSENFFETGGSYGGYMTNWIIGHTDRFKACASQRSISNWFSFYGVSDIGPGFCSDQNQADPWSDPEKLWWHSPLKYAENIKTPTLFIHSFEDYRCPIDQGYQMLTALIRHGVETKLVAFRGENHDLSRSGRPAHRVKRLDEITKWFENHK